MSAAPSMSEIVVLAAAQRAGRSAVSLW
jgi:hypothetical protein